VISQESFSQFLDALPSDVILGGDFNARVRTPGIVSQNFLGQNLYFALLDSTLVLLNSEQPTHVGRYGAENNALDLSFVSSNLAVNLQWYLLQDVYGSDHIPICMKIEIQPPKINTTPTFQQPGHYWILKRICWSSFQDECKKRLQILEEPGEAQLKYTRMILLIQDSVTASLPTVPS
jgi:hypothetical protein